MNVLHMIGIIDTGGQFSYFVKNITIMTPTSSHPLAQEEFVRLAELRHPHAVTMYLPMDIKGKEQNRHLAQGRLKQCLKQAATELADWEVSAEQVTKLLEPARQLLNEVQLWRNPSEGLVIFLSPDADMEYFTIPFAVEQRTYVDRHFLLSPLLPLYHNDGRYYLLELSRDYVKLFEASRFEFRDLQLEKDTPVQLEDAVGHDFEQKNLQFHSGRGTQGSIFHGHGSGKDDDKKEMVNYLRQIHEGVVKRIADAEAPLLLSCVDELAALYRKVNPYPALYEKNLGGDPEFKTPQQRHEASWELIRPHFEKDRELKRQQYQDSQHTSKASLALDEIIPAVVNGKVDTLYINRDEALYGTYDKEQQRVQLDIRKKVGNTSLTDLAAMNTFLQGGKVYFLPAAEMPAKNTVMNAVFRF